MINTIGVPREIKNNERRVGMTPQGVASVKSTYQNLVKIFVEHDAGVGSGYSNSDYIVAGAELVDCAYDNARLIVKVKEPQASEVKLINDKHVLFCYLHLAASKTLTQALIDTKCVALAYETLVVDNKTPLLAPMSDVAGRVAVQRGSAFMNKLLSGVVGVPSAHVMVIGAGVVGTSAAETAKGMGARVTVVDTSIDALKQIAPMCVGTILCDSITGKMLEDVDMLVGAVHSPGKKAQHVVSTRAMTYMKRGSVAVDVSIDQGGCFEGSRATSHDEPTFEDNGIIYYCVPNLPAVVPHTSTRALCNVTLPYVKKLVMSEFDAMHYDVFWGALNLWNGKIINKAVKDVYEGT
jgi:alanine dehydrogenase